MALLTPQLRRAVGSTLWLAAAGTVLPAALRAQTPAARLEQEIKAAYLLNFTRYVDWPETSFGGPDAPVDLCVAGDEAFGAVVRASVEGRRSRGRPVRVLLPDTPAQAEGCHVAFLAGPSAAVEPWLRALRGHPALTVGDREEFLDRGGMVAFVVVNDAVRFEINQGSTSRAGLQISSRVLALATRVRGEKTR
jgi:YfiR/HmsC-like